jgi:hypothetical protein
MSLMWSLIAYVAVLAWRMIPLRLLWHAPQFHGRDWFFDVHVGDEFYDGRGREVAGEYHRKILVPHLLELPLFAAALIVLRNYPIAIFTLLAVTALSVSLYHVRVAKCFAKRAWDFESPATKPVTALAAPLLTPAQRAKRKPAVEWAIGLAAPAALGLLAYAQWHGGHSVNRFELWAPRITFLYLALGAELVRRVVAEARITQIPAENAEKYLAWREMVRGTWLSTCDWIRGLLVLGALLFSVDAALPYGSLEDGWQRFVAAAPLAVYVVLMCVSLKRGQQRLIEVTKTLKGQPRMTPRSPLPMEKPLVGLAASVGKTPHEFQKNIFWLACWSPDHPKVLVRAARGYALNLANPRAYVYLAYSAGLAALALWIGARA